MARAKVCILTAGKGTRMGPYASYINKALLPVGGRAAITRIIESFPKGTGFVVALGFLGEQVRDYLSVAHPELAIEFAQVDHFEGPGSGPGRSLLACENQLQCPFFFVSADTLWSGALDLEREEDWMGVARVPEGESASYCNLVIGPEGTVTAFRDKEAVRGPEFQSFVGLARIQDFARFWRGLRSSELVAGEAQVSRGFKALLDGGRLRAVPVEWTDIGDYERYKRAVLALEDFDFTKSGEFIYSSAGASGGRVTKFFADAKIARCRVERARMNPGVFPAIDRSRGQFYGYAYVEGQTLYQQNDARIFAGLLHWLETEVWKPVSVQREAVRHDCERFYREKTLERLKLYSAKFPGSGGPSRINGVDVPATSDLLERVPWERLFEGVPVFFHGDLQFDNILWTPDGGYVLLDWRQDFAGKTDYGDLYYDLAKLRGGIRLNYDLIKKNQLSYEERPEGIVYSFAQRDSTPGYLAQLDEFIARKGLDLAKVKLLVAVIYLNMAPLHEGPFDRLLYSLGRLTLFEELRQFSDSSKKS